MATDTALDRGRDAFRQHAWEDAYIQLSAVDHTEPLGPDDLDRLATAAYLTGRDPESIAVWTRAHHAFVDRGELERAARCGFWLSHNLLLAGEAARSRGWLSRTERLLDDGRRDCVERGYLLVVLGLYAMGEGDAASSYATNCQVTKIAERFGDVDLATLGLLCQGKALVELGELAEAMGRLDEAIVAVASGQVSPIATGIVYCAAILACREASDLARANEWTAALHHWCSSQPDLVPFRGACLVHRSEVMQLHGAWVDAMLEAQRACEWLAEPRQPALALAFYQRAELHRLRGELAEAEAAYRQASHEGLEPQPGLSLLRLAQGRVDEATAAIDRVVEEAEAEVPRSRLLAPFVEIMLASGKVDAARAGADELETIAGALDVALLRAASAQATGTVLLAEGEATAALAALRQAWAVWQELDAPYDAARVRVHLGRACRERGDHDTAEMHLDAARSAFEQLGAAPDASWALKLSRSAASVSASGLTPREREVLALVATGATNRQIAEALVISGKTVERHVTNIFTKLGVSSRAAATAYAHQHDLV